jgi:hypothetical protein
MQQKNSTCVYVYVCVKQVNSNVTVDFNVRVDLNATSGSNVADEFNVTCVQMCVLMCVFVCLYMCVYVCSGLAIEFKLKSAFKCKSRDRRPGYKRSTATDEKSCRSNCPWLGLLTL